MASTLSDRLSRLVKTMRGQARITEDNVQDMLREVRMALLEADVALPVVRDFIARVKLKALGQEVVGSLSPGQALVGVVHRELAATMGGTGPDGSAAPAVAELNLATQPPAVILMAGLQGAGKTTTTAKLARHLVGRKKKVLTVSGDVYRPAAIEQLRVVTQQAGAEWFPSVASDQPVAIAMAALDHAKRHFFDVLLVDTAGRLAIDEALMAEIQALHAALRPIETLFVVDAMQGQDAVNVARAFSEALPITGIVLTKLDGDSRGGAALSVRQVTGAPIKFAGVSEKIDGLEVFDAERHAGRVLGMGDILALVEQVQQGVDLDAAQKLATKVKSGGGFDLDDFLMQLSQMQKMGGLSGLMDKLPSQLAGKAGQLGAADMDRAEREMRRMRGIIHSMTPLERRKPELLKATRKRRIAAGAGVQVQEVNRLLNQFEQMQSMMKKMQGGGLMKMMKRMGGMKGLPR
jgi:signal recognition particle subunit SRP54